MHKLFEWTRQIWLSLSRPAVVEMAAGGMGLENGKTKGDTFQAKRDLEQSSFMARDLIH